MTVNVLSILWIDAGIIHFLPEFWGRNWYGLPLVATFVVTFGYAVLAPWIFLWEGSDD